MALSYKLRRKYGNHKSSIICDFGYFWLLLKGILGVFYVVGMAIALIFGAMLGVLQVVFSLNASREKKNNKKLHTRRK